MIALLVGAGGAFGSLARYGIATAFPPDTRPWAIVAINIAGSFMLGIFIGATPGLSEEVRAAVGAGLLGGFTTFSTFSMDVFGEFEAGRPAQGLLIVLASVLGGVLAATCGWFAGRAFG